MCIPRLLNDAGRRWGLPDDHHFEEVLGLDPVLLGMVSAPAVAVVLLFPCTEKIYTHRLKQDLRRVKRRIAVFRATQMQRATLCLSLSLGH